MTAATEPATPTHRPTVAAGALAVAAGVVAVLPLLDTAAQWRALLLELAGLAVVVAGYAAWRRRTRAGGLVVGVAGAALVVAGLALGVTGPAAVVDRLELLPGLVGLAVLVAGLLPVRPGRERPLVTVGAALLFVGVLTAGVVRGADLLPLLVAGVASVLAWDLGHQATSLGRQAGRGARTRRAELVHAGGTALAGAVVVALALAVRLVDIGGLSLTGLSVLLVAAVALVAALRH